MNKGTFYNLLGMILVVSMLSVFGMSAYILEFGVMNDYVFYELQEQSEQLVADNVISANYSNITLDIAETYQETIYSGDNIWLLFYIIFIILTIGSAYSMKDSNDVGLFMFLFYGLILFLFFAGIIETFTSWFIDSITTKLIPNALTYFPKFSWYINNIGIINLIHSIILLAITRFNFNFARKEQINNSEVEAVMSNEDEVY